MSQALPIGWTDAFTRGVTSTSEAERAATLGAPPWRRVRVSEAETHQSRQRGNRRSQLARSKALRLLTEEEP